MVLWTGREPTLWPDPLVALQRDSVIVEIEFFFFFKKKKKKVIRESQHRRKSVVMCVQTRE